jgi:hypothetical protein
MGGERIYFFREVEREELRRRDVPFFPCLELVLRDVLELLFFLAPPFLPPPVSLLTVAQARRAASPLLVPRRLYPLSMCSACRFCLDV